MFKVFKSIEDAKPVSSSSTFEDAAGSATVTLKDDSDAAPALIFYQTDTMSLNGRRKLAGIVNRNEVIELMFLPFLYFEIHVETAFRQINVHFCHEPSLETTCLKLLSYNNKIVSIRPVTQKEFYRKLGRPLPF